MPGTGRARVSFFFAKALMIAGYALFVIAYFLVCYVSRVIPLFAICPIFTWILVFFTWRYVSYDIYFEFKSGTLEIGTSSGSTKGKKKTLKHRIHIKEALVIIRYSGNPEELGRVDELFDYSQSKLSENRLGIVYEKAGKRYGVIIECTTKCVSLIAAYNPLAKPLKGEKFHA